MSFSVNYAGNGNFTMVVDGKSQTLNLADLNMMLRMDQVAGYDQGIADQLGEIQKTNAKRKGLNQLLATMRQYKSEGRSDDYANTDKNKDEVWGTHDTEKAAQGMMSGAFKLDGQDGKARSVHAWLDHFGVSNTDANHFDSQEKRDTAWDANINAIKTEIDNVTSDSEMQMLRFRQMVDKRGTALQEAKTTLSNDKRLKDAILQG